MAKGNRAVGVNAEMDVSSFNKGLMTYINGLNNMVSATVSSVSQVNSAANAITTGISAAIGTAAIGAVQTFIGWLGKLGQEAITQVGFFERLAISLNFYAARAIQSARDGLGLADAMVESRDAAEDLMIWLQQLALASPFTTRQVADAFRTAQAYGLSLDSARKLVPLMIDFAAVNNLSEDILTRISLAIGQISARGKLAAQEINQLANAGVPVRDLLAKGLGVTRGEFEKLLEQGLVPATDAIQIITKYFEQFEGMANDITRNTLTGMISQFKDLQEIATRDIFGGISHTTIPVLNEISDFVNTPQTFAGLELLGNLLGTKVRDGITLARDAIASFIETVTNLPIEVKKAAFVFVAFSALMAITVAVFGALAIAIGLLVNEFTVLIAIAAGFAAAWVAIFTSKRKDVEDFRNGVVAVFKNIGDVIGNFASFASTQIGRATTALTQFAADLSDWGSAIIGNLASGILDGVGLITQALGVVGELMTFWLKPGSPPKLLPDLEKWGKETANVWLKSWGSADFSILKDMTDDISGMLKGLVAAGSLGEEKPPRILIELRPLIAEAIDEFKQFGSISKEALKQMAAAAGPAGDTVIPLIQRYVALAAATDAVKAAQNTLTAITERYAAILKPIQDRLTAISKLRGENDENREILSLQRAIANVGVSGSIKKSAQLRIQEILLGRQVKALEGQQTAEKDVADAALTDAEKKQKAAEEGLSSMRAQIDAQNTQLNLYGEEARILEQIRKEQERLAKEALKAQLDALKKQVEIVNLLQAELKDTVAKFKDEYILQDATATVAEKAAAALDLQRIAADRIVRDFEAVQLGIDPAVIEKIRATVVTLKDIGVKGTVDDLNDALDLAVDSIDDLSEKAKQARKDVQEYFSGLLAQWDAFIADIDKALPPFLRFRNEVAGASVSTSDAARSAAAANEAFGKGPPIFRTFATLIAGLAAAFASTRLIAILTAIPGMIVKLASGMNPLILAVSLLAAAWAGDWFDIRKKTAEAITFIQAKFNEIIQSDFWAKIVDRFTQWKDTIQGFVDEAIVFLTGLVTQIKGIVQTGFDPKNLKTALDGWLVILSDFAAKITTFFTSTLPMAVTQFFTYLGSLIQKYWNPFTAILLLNLGSVKNVFLSLFTPLLTGLKFILPTVLGFFSGLPGAILSRSVMAFKLAGGAMSNAIFSGIAKTGIGPAIANVIAKGISGSIGIALKGINFSGIGQALSGFGKTSFFATAQANAKSISNAMGGAANFIEKAYIPVLAILKAVVDVSKAAIRPILTSLGIVKNTGDAIRTVFSIVFLVLRDSFNMARGLVGAFKSISAGSFAATFFANIKSLRNATQGKLPIIQQLSPLLALFKTLGDHARAFINTFLRIGQIKGNFISAILAPIPRLFVDSITMAKRFFSVFTSIPTILGGAVKSLGGFFTLFKGIGQKLNFSANITGSLGKIGGVVKGFLSSLTGAGGQIKISGGIQTVFGTVTSFLSNLSGGAGKAAFNSLSGIFGIFGKLKLSGLVNGFGTLMKIIKNVAVAFEGFLNPLDIVLAAIDFFFFAFRTDIAGVENPLKKFVSNLKLWWADLISGKIWGNIVSGFKVGFQWIIDAWNEFQSGGLSSPKLQARLSELGTTIVTSLQTIGAAIWKSITEFWLPVFGMWVKQAVEGLATQLGDFLIFMRDWIFAAGTWLHDQFVLVWLPAFTTWWDSGGGTALGTTLQTILDTVWGWIVTASTFIYEQLIATWVPGFVDWIFAVTPGLLTGLGNLLLWLLNWIVEQVPGILDTLLIWATAFVQWLGPVVEYTLAHLGEWIGAILQWIIGTGIPLLLGITWKLVSALVDWIAGTGPTSATGQAPSSLATFLAALVNFIINDIVPGVVAAAAAIGLGIWRGIVDAWNLFLTTSWGIEVQKLWDNISGWATRFYEAGSLIAQAIWNGVVYAFNYYIGDPIVAFVAGIQAIIDAGKHLLGIASPSTLIEEVIGQPMIAGLVKGVESIYNNPLFDGIKNLAVSGFGLLRDGAITIFDNLALEVNTIIEGVKTTTIAYITDMRTLVMAQLVILATDATTLLEKVRVMFSTKFLAMKTDALTNSLAIYTGVLKDMGNLYDQLLIKMPLIVSAVVSAFVSMGTAIGLEVDKMIAAVITKLAGDGTAEDTTSLAAQLKLAMGKAGQTIGEFFVSGIAMGIKSEQSLLILTDAIYTIVKAAFAEANKQLENGSPSKRAAREIGLPWSQGVASGMLKGVSAISSAASIAAAASLNAQLASEFGGGLSGSVPGYSNYATSNRTYQLNVNSRQNSQGLINDFALMKSVDI